jgi:hypothetical protein
MPSSTAHIVGFELLGEAMRTAAKAGLIGVGVLVALIVAAVVFVAVFDWSRATGWVASQASERLNREVTLGDLEVDLALPLRVRLKDVTVANIDGGSRPAMARIELLEFRLRLLPLLWGRLALPQIHLARPDLLLEKNRDGEPNWQLGDEEREQARGPAPVIGHLRVDDGRLAYRDPAAKTDIEIELATTASNGEPRLRVKGDGQYQGGAFSLEGQGGSLLSLRDRNDPYPLTLTARAGGTRAYLNGTLTDPLNLTGIDIDLKLKGPDLAKMHDFINLPLPATPPYDLEGHLWREGETWRFADFKGRVGDSDLAGNFAVDLAPTRPRIRADLTSTRLDFDDLAPLIGAPPKTGPGETESAQQRKEAARAKRRANVLPVKEYDLQKLRAVDADVQLKAKHIEAPGLPLDNLDTHVRLEDGVLSLQPLNFGVADGNLVSQVTLDARRNPIRTQAKITVRALHLQKLFPNAPITKTSASTIGGKAALETTGNSLAQMAARADGQLGLAATGGQISNLLLELAGIDAAEALRFFLGKDKTVPLRCAVADFKINDGTMRTDALVIDTADTKIVGEGVVHLGGENLDLTFHPQPKDPSILSARGPLHIRGSFKNPDFELSTQTIARGAAALALGALAGPLAALVPLIETGPGEDSPCRALVAETRKTMREAEKQ